MRFFFRKIKDSVDVKDSNGKHYIHLLKEEINRFRQESLN
jgi:hypothetical protein